jgi:HSP20 family molecular chaperone IbpA
MKIKKHIRTEKISYEYESLEERKTHKEFMLHRGWAEKPVKASARYSALHVTYVRKDEIK